MNSNIEFYYEYEDTYDGSYRLYPLNKDKYGDQLQQLLQMKDGEIGELHSNNKAGEIPIIGTEKVTKPELKQIYVIKRYRKSICE